MRSAAAASVLPSQWEAGLDELVAEVELRAELWMGSRGSVLATLAGLVLAGSLAVLWARRARRSTPLAVSAAAALVAALVVTLVRPGDLHRDTDWAGVARCTVTDPWAWSTEARLNVLLLAPFALLATAAGARLRSVLLASLTASVVIELLQAARDSGVCDSSDLLRNTFGAAAAAGVTVVIAAARRSVGEEVQEDGSHAVGPAPLVAVLGRAVANPGEADPTAAGVAPASASTAVRR
jgi:hypothetical protein